MKNNFGTALIMLAIFVTLAACQSTANAASSEKAAEIDQNVDVALKKLFETTPLASELRKKAVGILIFPNILKAGFIVGAQFGEGALRQNGKTTGYYNTVAASYGLQAGAQQFGYALIFMNKNALSYLNDSDGWEVGVGPNIVLVDEGVAKSMTTTTAKDDVYAFFFNQKGLMAGVGLQGSKITRINP